MNYTLCTTGDNKFETIVYFDRFGVLSVTITNDTKRNAFEKKKSIFVVNVFHRKTPKRFFRDVIKFLVDRPTSRATSRDRRRVER